MHAVVITDGLSVRQKGEPFATLVTELSRGDEVEVLELGTQRTVGERWHKVRVLRKANGLTVDNGKAGYAWAPGLRITTPVKPPEPEPEPEPVPPKSNNAPSFEKVLAVVIGIIALVVGGLYWLL